MVLKTSIEFFTLNICVLLCLKQPIVDAVEFPDKIISSFNVSKPFVGETFIMKCEVPSYYSFEPSRTFINFCNDFQKNQFAYYDVIGKKKRIKFDKSDFSSHEKQYISAVNPREIVTHNGATSFEIEITPKVIFSTQFYCQVKVEGSSTKNYTKTLITVTEAPPVPRPPTLNSSVKTLQLNQPFTLTCLLQPNTQLPSGRSYSVSFYSSQDGQIAIYDVDVSGNSFFSFGESNHTIVHFGNHSTFPVFDIVVTEKINLKQNFWCELSVDWIHEKKESNKWNYIDPTLEFISDYNGVEHHGQCIIANFEKHAEKEYQVHFISTLGPSSINRNRLGYYWKLPNQKALFTYEHLSDYWFSIAHGANTAFPNFEIVAQAAVNVSGKTWWCELHIRAPGIPDPPQISVKSAVKSL